LLTNCISLLKKVQIICFYDVEMMPRQNMLLRLTWINKISIRNEKGKKINSNPFKGIFSICIHIFI
jgi:hypothetical protein